MQKLLMFIIVIAASCAKKVIDFGNPYGEKIKKVRWVGEGEFKSGVNLPYKGRVHIDSSKRVQWLAYSVYVDSGDGCMQSLRLYSTGRVIIDSTKK